MPKFGLTCQFHIDYPQRSGYSACAVRYLL